MRNTARQTRENRTITIDFHDETTYFRLLDDGKGELADFTDRHAICKDPDVIKPHACTRCERAIHRIRLERFDRGERPSTVTNELGTNNYRSLADHHTPSSRY